MRRSGAVLENILGDIEVGEGPIDSIDGGIGSEGLTIRYLPRRLRIDGAVLWTNRETEGQ